MLCHELSELKQKLVRAACHPVLTELTRLVCGRCTRLETCSALAIEQVVYLQTQPHGKTNNG
ncbi:MAG: hypothetical protein Q8M16_24325 [Pirellulaceae bacterium]|nr:hypothetical protein [Pirellulaceae bacterium]